ncbi:MAG: substrate-binding domain-containing protein [Caldilineaceae bacterium]
MNGACCIALSVGVDALAIVVSRDNSFVEEASIEELQQIFAYARRWSDIHADWPDTPILRVIPGSQSGTFDYFVEAVMEKLHWLKARGTAAGTSVG